MQVLAAVAAGAVDAAEARHMEVQAVQAGVRYTAVQAAPVPAWALRKEAPNAVLRAGTEVRRIRAGVVAAVGEHIEASRHPAQIG